ncbi:MAG: membrane-bound lytic murein transglycosylase MltF [Ectothiorhodospiraceae bacterium]|nr:membrane-bound lytic murein transglycosylase MltF [Ectothiorhodospiraceae bacterium]
MPQFRAGGITLLLATALIAMAAGGALYHPTAEERVQRSGELRVAMLTPMQDSRNGGQGPLGLEHDLVRHFAETLGVSPVFLLADSKADLYRSVAAGDADVAIGGLSISGRRDGTFRYTEPFAEADRQLIYRFGDPTPVGFDQIAGDGDAELAVLAHSPHAERLRELRDERHPELYWTEVASGSTEELLFRVWNRELDFTVANSIDVMRTQRYYPELRVAFNLDEGIPLRWVLSADSDDTLLAAANRFIADAQQNGLLAYLQEKHLGHLREFDYVGARVFLRHVTERLPEFRPLFQEAAREQALDWRLLAAIGYQESHWNPRAVSPTGVRGVMMLTQRTAADLGVTDRLDPAQSIHGGARYFRSLRERIPERIEEPARTWFALAAYNVGMGHLEDARRLTETRGGDPDAWTDVKETLPLLADPEWHSQTRYGYARGWEPVIYVAQVRTYYELLLRIADQDGTPVPASTMPPAVPYAETRRELRLGEALESAL